MTTIATICARGGSVGVPGKNLRPLLGKPLVAYSIEQALACREIDHVYVSTDSAAIAEIARQCGARVPFIRPAHLATHTAPKLPVIWHLVEYVEASGTCITRIVDLDPTSPLRDQSDIAACLALLDDRTDVVITGYESDKNPYFNMVEARADGGVGLVKIPSGEISGRQSAPKVYAMNASIYVWHRHTLSKGLWNGFARLHVMPRTRSIDVDSELDFKLVEFLMKEKHGA
jgi:CMP-N,N'-diacetyllegionaminic acid synthase